MIDIGLVVFLFIVGLGIVLFTFTLCEKTNIYEDIQEYNGIIESIEYIPDIYNHEFNYWLQINISDQTIDINYTTAYKLTYISDEKIKIYKSYNKWFLEKPKPIYRPRVMQIEC